jgi:RND superfamily putative drug exporter
MSPSSAASPRPTSTNRQHLGPLPLFIAAVIVLSFLLLLAVFRSVLVAFKAAVLSLL